jgi:predicted RNA binding protein YcfA (HicA-like mRNA interferase family)
MPALPIVKSREVVRAFEWAGFVFARQVGSHMRYHHPDGRAVTIVDYGGGDYPRGTLRKLLRDAGLSVADFISLLTP